MADPNKLLAENAFRDPMSDGQRARIEAVGVPVDDSPSFGGLIAAIHQSSLPPTEAEVRLLRAYIEFVLRTRYREPFASRALGAERPAVSGHNTLMVRKDTDSWRYQRNSWQTPSFPRYDSQFKFDLPALLDHVENLLPDQYAAFAAEHAELISAAADPARRIGSAPKRS